LGGTLYGIKKTYDLGSAVDGELTENGKQKLSYSLSSYTAEEAGPSTDVIFSLLNAKRVSLKQMFTPNFRFPLHANNEVRGLFKIQQESQKICAFSAGATIAAGVLTKSFPIQTLLVLGTTGLFGAHRGNQTVGCEDKRFNDSEQVERPQP
jgi:hypothetical protein